MSGEDYRVLEAIRLLSEAGRLDLVLGDVAGTSRPRRQASARVAAVVAACASPKKSRREAVRERRGEADLVGWSAAHLHRGVGRVEPGAAYPIPARDPGAVNVSRSGATSLAPTFSFQDLGAVGRSRSGASSLAPTSLSTGIGGVGRSGPGASSLAPLSGSLDIGGVGRSRTGASSLAPHVSSHQQRDSSLVKLYKSGQRLGEYRRVQSAPPPTMSVRAGKARVGFRSPAKVLDPPRLEESLVLDYDEESPEEGEIRAEGARGGLFHASDDVLQAPVVVRPRATVSRPTRESGPAVRVPRSGVDVEQMAWRERPAQLPLLNPVGEIPWASLGGGQDADPHAGTSVDCRRDRVLQLVVGSLAVSTRTAYELAWKEFLESGAGWRAPGWRRSEDVVQFILHLIDRGLTRVTIAGKLAGIAFMGKLLWGYSPSAGENIKEMSDHAPLYTVDYIKHLCSLPSLLSETPDVSTATNSTLPEQLEKLRKKQVRLQLMILMLTDYLKSEVIPVGLQVRNIPGIFTDNPKYVSNFSYIGTTCSRHWLALGIDIATETLKSLEIEISDLLKQINDSDPTSDCKKLLEQVEKTVADFHCIEQNKKSNKIKKDIKNYNIENTYPYLNKDFYTNRPHFNPNNRPWGRYNK
ncbi:uncharacterized protein LOC144773887 [Lissotriton helveticus]